MLPGARWGLGIGFAGTFIFFIALGSTISYTNTLEFCTSCHTMSIPLEEYKKSPHYRNSVGIRAECPDCHVPHDYPDVLIAKVMAAKDVYHEILGTIDTPEKFETHRLKMAKRVWDKMDANQSKECRSCHDFESMIVEDHGRRARRKHKEAIQEGGHCIQCHKGVAHEIPKGYEG